MTAALRAAFLHAASLAVVLGTHGEVAASSAMAGPAVPRAARCGHRIAMGVDYYPEQGLFEDFEPDMKAIKEDLGADFVRVGEFMWHLLEPANGAFNFTLLDSVVDLAETIGLEVMLGTPTATAPIWLYTAHPDIFARRPDTGDDTAWGGRQQRSFNSPVYSRYSKRIVTKLAERYGQRKALTFWQVDNEMGNEQSDLDFSNVAQDAWRVWLRKKYGSNIDKLNEKWGTVFWSATYDAFSEIPGAAQTSMEFRSNMSPGMLLDYRRFRADSIADFANMQVAILREKQVVGCITTNINGGYWGRAIDHNTIYEKMDFPAYDNYPVWGGSLEPDAPGKVALMLDTVRGWAPQKDRTAGFMVAEQLIGAQGHNIIGYTPRPDQIVAWSTQALLHGATSLAFFRYRAANIGQEMFCYGILDQTTPRGSGRKWNEAKKFYQIARTHEDLWLGPLQSEVALVYCIDGIFSWNAQPQSTAFDYITEAYRMYYPFWRAGAGVDVVSMQRLLTSFNCSAALFDRFKVVLLPAPIILPDGLIDMLRGFTELGGTLWIGFRADLKDESNAIRRSASRLASLAGVEISEIESLNTPLKTPIKSADGSISSGTVWRDGLIIPKASTAKAAWVYTDKFFGVLGLSAVTKLDTTAGGCVVYMGTALESDMLMPLAAEALKRHSIRHAGLSESDNLEQLLRNDVNGKVWRIAINHGEDPSPATDGKTLGPYVIDISLVADNAISGIGTKEGMTTIGSALLVGIGAYALAVVLMLFVALRARRYSWTDRVPEDYSSDGLISSKS